MVYYFLIAWYDMWNTFSRLRYNLIGQDCATIIKDFLIEATIDALV